jgi:predicted transcriptional regulator/ABC-type transporter Mla MlaB component
MGTESSVQILKALDRISRASLSTSEPPKILRSSDLKRGERIAPAASKDHRNGRSKSELRNVFKAIVESGVAEFAPSLSDGGDIIYPMMNKLTGVGTSQAGEVLEELCQKKVLTKVPASLSCRCPACSTEIAIQTLVCPNCSGTELVSGTALQHLTCLHFDFEWNFSRGTEGEKFCPKCDRKLEKMGIDYLKQGTFFKCSTCGEFTARAKRLFSCPSCQRVFETTKEPPIEAYKYIVKNGASLSALDLSALIGELKNSGLEATENATIRGKSGTEHSFTLVVKDSAGTSKDRANLLVAVDIIDMAGADTTAVLLLFAKSMDCDARRRILVTIPGVSEQTKALAQSYQISVLESPDTSRASELLFERVCAIFGVGKTSQKGKRTAGRRGSMDIISDILSIVSAPSGKSEIISCANLSFEQCQKYLAILERMGLLRRYLEDAVRVKYMITERGREYMRNISGEFGRIAEGDRSVWDARRQNMNETNEKRYPKGQSSTGSNTVAIA